MPASYIAYLDGIAHYHRTSLRQHVGAFLFLAVWAPVLFLIVVLQKVSPHFIIFRMALQCLFTALLSLKCSPLSANLTVNPSGVPKVRDRSLPEMVELLNRSRVFDTTTKLRKCVESDFR